MKEMVRYAFILGIICALASGVLAGVNALTEPQIEIQKQKNEQSALKIVLPQAERFEERKDNDKVIYFVGLDAQNKVAGFVIKTSAKGYSSDIEVMTGLDTELKITEIKILSQNETPGLGTQIAEKPFCDQFKGKGIDSYDSVEAITGATISSSAVIKSVKEDITSLSERLRKEL